MSNHGIIDLHCDTIISLGMESKQLRENDGHISLLKMRDGGALAQCFAIFIISHVSPEKKIAPPYEFFQNHYKVFVEQIEKNSDLIAQARNYDEIIKNHAEGKMSAILTIEDAVPVEDKIERIREFYDKGVRIMSFTWNHENTLGYPNSPDPEKHMLHLKPFGLDCLALMEELGMTADVSHLNEGGFWDVVEHCKKPFVATHSCCRALCDHPRNLTDDQLRALAEKGGVMGINFMSDFLIKDSGNYTKTQYIVDHMLHVKKIAGIDTVAFGSDFDGIGCDLEFKDYAGLPQVIDAMGRVFTDDEIDKIAHGNMLRIIKENW